MGRNKDYGKLEPLFYVCTSDFFVFGFHILLKLLESRQARKYAL